MPIYEYECLSCKEVHEKIQKFADEQLTICPKCGGKLKKLISNTSFVLKGTGWYKTDYPSSTSRTAIESEKKEDKKTETKPETKTETKAEAKAETKTEAAAKA
ncbi:MAG: zinc ribbon domain-containing protein [Nitrospirota bacterium]|nr:zinc ribbon domain-containing protein [Nitrospirota bacterium]